MLSSVPLGELAWLAAAIVAGGLVTGILAGLFGIGGGAIIVPVLYEVFRVIGVPEEVRIQLCIGTSLAIIVPTTIRSYQSHRETGIGVEGIVRLWWLPALIGVGLGSALAVFAPPAVFKIAFVVVATVIAGSSTSASQVYQNGVWSNTITFTVTPNPATSRASVPSSASSAALPPSCARPASGSGGSRATTRSCRFR